MQILTTSRTIAVFLGLIELTRISICCPSVLGIDRVSIRRDEQSLRITGTVLVEAQDGGLLVLDRSNVLWAVTPHELIAVEKDNSPFKQLGSNEQAGELLKEFPNGFKIHKTAHYVICYNTSKAYAEWCGALYERLFLAFCNYWRKRGFELEDPDFPLIALVFDSKAAYSRYAKGELGDATSSIIGYFSLRTNRVTMYDLTGVNGSRARVRTGSAAHVNRILARPEAERMVATIIHEATHQLAFSCGLQRRYADIPLWVSEGVAIYFETPDLRSSRGWRGIGSVNRVRLQDFRRYLQTRPSDSLRTLISTDERFRNSRTAADAYAEAWSLIYFLIRRHPQQFFQYMHTQSEKQALVYEDPAERIAEFTEHFGELREVDRQFLRYMRTVR